MDNADDDMAQAFHAWIDTQSRHENVLQSRGVELHRGPRVYKSASLRTYGNRETGSVSRTELRFGSYPRKEFGPGYDFDAPERNTWSCVDEQIDRVRALLNDAFAEDGYYIRIDKGTALEGLTGAIDDGTISVDALATLVRALATVPGVVDALAGTEAAEMLSGMVERHHHRAGLAALREAVEDESSSEQDLQRILESHWWMFGSRYVGASARRKLTLTDQFDIPLIRADGALHVVELKRAAVPKLLIEHRTHVVLGPEVHLAVSQAQNYLAELDRQEAMIRAQWGLECRRAFATVVVGHSMYCDGYSRKDVSDVLRVYNSHLSRIEVITYEDLLEGAQRSLELTTERNEDADGGQGW